MDLNRIAAFLGDEKINYFSMQRSAKHTLKLGIFSVSSLLFGVYSPCYTELILGLTAGHRLGGVRNAESQASPQTSRIRVSF